MGEFNIVINEQIKPQTFTKTLRTKGRVQIPDFLSGESAEGLYQLLHEHRNWYVTVNRASETYQVPLETFQQLPSDEKFRFMQENYLGASKGFQFYFLRQYLSGAAQEGYETEDSLIQFHFFANSPVFLEFMKVLTEETGIKKADTFASIYEPGHFLTAHSDTLEGNDRAVAFVVNLTKDWNPDWGGHLHFYDDEGNIKEGFMPSFNTLNVFTIPQSHAVAMVNPFATAKRSSFFGWMLR